VSARTKSDGQSLRQELGRFPHRSYITAKVDFATVQGLSIGERARTEPANVFYRDPTFGVTGTQRFHHEMQSP
jgi:hypothetical protein